MTDNLCIKQAYVLRVDKCLYSISLRAWLWQYKNVNIAIYSPNLIVSQFNLNMEMPPFSRSRTVLAGEWSVGSCDKVEDMQLFSDSGTLEGSPSENDYVEDIRGRR